MHHVVFIVHDVVTAIGVIDPLCCDVFSQIEVGRRIALPGAGVGIGLVVPLVDDVEAVIGPDDAAGVTVVPIQLKVGRRIALTGVGVRIDLVVRPVDDEEAAVCVCHPVRICVSVQQTE